jgi:hypothetical protein
LKVSITGSREYNDYFSFKSCLNDYIKANKIFVTEIISGGAKGTDTMAHTFAIEYNVPIKLHLPEWDKYGKSAGFIRNKLILDDAEMNFIFWNNVSKGAQWNISYCLKHNRPFKVFNI